MITSSQTGGFTSAPFLLRRRSRFVQSAGGVALGIGMRVVGLEGIVDDDDVAASTGQCAPN